MFWFMCRLIHTLTGMHLDGVRGRYGATPSGIAAAVAAARAGMTVAVVEQTDRIGGMITGGLSCSDTGNASVIGGIAREVFVRIGAEYGLSNGTAGSVRTPRCTFESSPQN